MQEESNTHGHTHAALYEGLKVEKKPGSTVDITGEITLDTVLLTREKALRRIVRDLELPGFRKGHVPLEMAEAHVGELAILQEIADITLSHAYAHILEEAKIDAIGRPSVTITKLAPGNPIGFKITTAVYPTIVLPKYKELAEAERKKHSDPEKETVSAEEVEAEVRRLQKIVHDSRSDKSEEDAAKDEEPLPEVTDEFAREVGDFADLADLRTKLEKRMTLEKKQKASDARRIAIMDRILEKIDVEVPAIFTENELNQAYAEFSDRIQRAGVGMSDYLSAVGKTEEELRREWRPDAEKRAKLEMVLSKIAESEGIEPDAARVDRECAHIMEHYSDAEEKNVRLFVISRIKNSMVLALLEGTERKAEEEEGAEG